MWLSWRNSRQTGPYTGRAGVRAGIPGVTPAQPVPGPADRTRDRGSILAAECPDFVTNSYINSNTCTYMKLG